MTAAFVVSSGTIAWNAKLLMLVGGENHGGRMLHTLYETAHEMCARTGTHPDFILESARGVFSCLRASLKPVCEHVNEDRFAWSQAHSLPVPRPDIPSHSPSKNEPANQDHSGR